MAADDMDTAAALAWSEDTSWDEPVGGSWWPVWLRAAALAVGGLVVAGLVVWGWSAWSARDSAPPVAGPVVSYVPPAPGREAVVSPAPVLPPTSGTVAQKMTTPPVAAPDPDAIYLQMLSDAGVKAPTAEKAIANGHLICQQLAQGNTVQDVVSEVGQVNPSLDAARSQGTVYAAIDAYCPQYENRGQY